MIHNLKILRERWFSSDYTDEDIRLYITAIIEELQQRANYEERTESTCCDKVKIHLMREILGEKEMKKHG